jgi:dTDP-4-dehydrorhamnose 3,5-epimerase
LTVKIIDVVPLAIPAIKVIRFARFRDKRGYFTEPFRSSDVGSSPLTRFLKGAEFPQTNESRSKPGTIRGLHFQWNPYMGKLVRTLSGHMIDVVLDIRKGSPTFGKAIAYDMPANAEEAFGEWIWVPPGFAHGNAFLADTSIEYFCSGEYSPLCEAGISPLAADIDWSLCDLPLKRVLDETSRTTDLITDKDRGGFSVAGWERDPRSNNFIYEQLMESAVA